MNTRLSDSSSRSSLRPGSWLSRLQVVQKIGLGYALVAGVVVTGAINGILIAQRYADEAFERNEDVVEEILEIKQLNRIINQFIGRERELITWFGSPDEFQANYSAYRDYAWEFEEGWVELLDEYEEDIEAGIEETEEELELLENLILNYSGVVDTNLRDVAQFVEEYKPGNLEGQRLIDAQQAFIALNRRPASLKLSQFSDDLGSMVEFIKDDELGDAREVVERSARTQLQVVIASIVSSIILAGLLAYYMSRAISRPLRDLEKTTLQVIQDEKFDVQATVSSHDEIGSLARSVNQLIGWVGEYTFALQSTQNDSERQAQELNAIIDNLGDGLLVTDSQGIITRANPTLEKMFELQDRGGLNGQSIQSVFGQQIADLVNQNQAYPQIQLSAELPLLDNQIGQALVTAITSDDPSATESPTGAVVLVRDITNEKEIDRMKTDFLSTVSHELRTPLTSVLGFAKLIQKKLEDTILPAVNIETKKTERSVRQVRDNLDIIVAEGERLTSLINDVLDISKIEAGKLEWNMQPLSTATILDRAMAATSVLARNSGLEMVSDIEPELPEVMGDRNRLIQVVINLLSNAIKFTDSGTITCRSYHQDSEVITSVIDTGIGLSADDIDKVFDKFTQVGAVMTDKPKGTGLGLPICKQIIEHHGGRIWVESTLDEGSTFSFSLPMRVPADPDPAASNLQSLVQRLKENVERAVTPTEKSQKTILVVDDEPHIRQLLRQELEAVGYQVETARDGMDALTQIKATPPDLIILDVMMPNINGFDLAAVIKNNPATMGIPTIVLSIIQDQERGYRLGVDRYLAKPIDRDVLLHDIETLLDQGTSNRQVLVVDIDASTTKTLTAVLLSTGYTVTQSRTGREGIQQALALEPDMIIVDSAISMEHDLINTLRFENGLETIFVIMVDQSEDGVEV
ncbi:MAG: ATP-binding protein [Cyanobacteria bacterium P01_F01_bin.116]